MENSETIRTSCTVNNADCECFDLLTPKQREVLEASMVTVEYEKGEVIAKQGSFATHVIFLCEGLLKVYYESKKEKLILKIVGPGSLVGLTSMTDESHVFNYTASAYVDSVAKLVPNNIFMQMVRENGQFASKIIGILSENTNQINGRFFCLTHRQSFGKLADLLLCLAGFIFKTRSFDLLLTRKELAELAGMSTESVIRILKKFQDDKLIEIEGKRFTIVDQEGLQKICDHG
jgi:CRP-like cAMP-binding protein